MKRKELPKDWWITMAKGAGDISKIQPIARKPLSPPPLSTYDVPPFDGISRDSLLTRREAADKLEIGMSALDGLIRSRMIFPHYRGRLVRIPIEEIENYNKRARMERDRRHA